MVPPSVLVLILIEVACPIQKKIVLQSFILIYFTVCLWSLLLVVDRVFRGDCSTKQVYEEGAKAIALSVVSGINCEYHVNILFC